MATPEWPVGYTTSTVLLLGSPVLPAGSVEKACSWCGKLSRRKGQEATRENWQHCSASCRVSRKNHFYPHSGKPCSEERREAIRASKIGKPNYKNRLIRGERHWNWQGGKTQELRSLRNSLEYKLWRKAVFERDHYICIWCGDGSGGNLHADHIKPFALFPELRFAIDNGRTLCVPCHKKTPTWGHKTSVKSRGQTK